MHVAQILNPASCMKSTIWMEETKLPKTQKTDQKKSPFSPLPLFFFRVVLRTPGCVSWLKHHCDLCLVLFQCFGKQLVFSNKGETKLTVVCFKLLQITMETDESSNIQVVKSFNLNFFGNNEAQCLWFTG